MNDKDFEGFLEWVTNFIATLGHAIAAALEMVPDNVLGFILIIFGLIFLWHKVKD